MAMGYSIGHLKQLERMINKSWNNFHTILENLQSSKKEFSKWEILKANKFCLENRFNAVYCSRAAIIYFNGKSKNRNSSLNMNTTMNNPISLDSS